MNESVSFKIQPQFVQLTDEEFNGHRLHRIQQALLHYDYLPEMTILTAPTGTGKSFAFPLPIIQHRKTGSAFSKRRCVIISPTNALIDDMENQYRNNFSQLYISTLNRKRLDELNAKGPDRWNALLSILRDNEIVITNPDLLNFAMFGGYIRHKGQKDVAEIFALIDYFVFDEYHLYDEEQIAHIFSWITLKKALLPTKPIKFIFASATPEKGLVEAANEQGYHLDEIIEMITADPSHETRPIHGEIEITFFKGTEPQEYLLSNLETIRHWIEEGQKILVIFAKMADLRRARIDVENEFDEVAIAEESGYFTKSKAIQDTTNARLILGTNKVEVGVNLDVTICLMQTGKHFANFVQRFGRVARGTKTGKVIVFLENKIKPIEKAFAGVDTLDYYTFIGKCRNIELLSDRKFYNEKVPQYMGAYHFIISKNIKDYETQKLYLKRIQPTGQTAFMFGLMRRIERGIRRLNKLNDACGKGFQWDLENWKKWWQIFANTFKYFRANSPDAFIRDLELPANAQFVRYSLEWVLKNRIVIGEEEYNGERCLVVSGFQAGQTDLQYYIESLPVYKLDEGTLYLQQKERYALKQAFEARIQKVALLYRGRHQFHEAARELLTNALKLKPIISEKRLSILDIKSWSNIL
jgi:CRISPR-associated endonuclease/helicase Cas3